MSFSKFLVPLLAGLLSFTAGLSAGLWLSARPARPAPCPAVDLAAVGGMVEKAVKAHAVQVQPFEVGKLKRVRGFTYAPVFYGCPCAKEQATLTNP